jgi:hypothetical protein
MIHSTDLRLRCLALWSARSTALSVRGSSRRPSAVIAASLSSTDRSTVRS